MPLPYGDRFKDRRGKLIPIGDYRLDRVYSLGVVRIARYSRKVTTASSEGASEIILWDAEGIGAWKKLPLPATRARVYVEKRLYRVRWLPYRSVASRKWPHQMLDGRFLIARPETEAYVLIVADRVFKEAWAYGPRGKRGPLT